jgi:ketosteroid isomerase-like protein
MRLATLAVVVAALAGGPAAAGAQSIAELQDQVRATERAFAKTMADRDHAGFERFLSKEAVFLSAKRTLRGPSEIAAAWKPYYEGAQAPFSWEPERVEVLESGRLALSTGPVRDPHGKLTGSFHSIWRREKGGVWRIVFDGGCPPCSCP